MEIFVETERLILREIVAEDENALFEVDSNPQVNTYLGNNPVKNIEQIRGVIQFIRQQYIDNGIGRWAMIEKKSNKFIGWSGLKLVKELTNNHINYYDLGYRLNQNYWGMGYATESAMACVDYGFKQLKQKEIFAMAHFENKASRHVIEKSGLKYIETFNENNIPHDWFKIEK